MSWIWRATSTPTRRFAAATVLMAMVFALVQPYDALAVHDTGAFQLDGNAQTSLQSPVPASEDWDKVCPAVSPPSQPLSNAVHCLGGTTADRSSFVVDAFGSATDDVFTGGGSKDDLDIPSWKWQQAAPSPDKDDLEHGYTAEYTITAAGPYQNHKVLFFGGDRFANNGDSNIAFWFFQNAISEVGNSGANCTLASGCGFSGTHTAGNVSLGGSTPGDIFIVSAFTIGGSEPTIHVYEWVGPGNASKPCFTQACTLQPIPLPVTAAGDNACDGATVTGDEACALVNLGVVDSPWLFTDKSKSSPLNKFQPAEFYEGGLDLTGIGFGEACFRNFLLNTRSSQSGDATLKDFVLGGFGRCGAGIVTTPNPSGSISIGTGSALDQDSALLTVTGVANWSGNVTFFLCGPIASGTCTTGGTQIGAPIAVTQATSQPINSASAQVTSVGRYCWRAEFASTTNGVPSTSDSGTDDSECFTVTPVTPTISTSATGPLPLGSAIDDTATLSGTAKQPGNPIISGPLGAAADGTITFNLYGPSATPICTTAIATRVVTVSGNGQYKASSGSGSGSLTPTQAGTYYWVATYSGNSPNTNGAATSCGDAGEASIITNSSTVTTPQDASGVNITSPVSIGTGTVSVKDKAVVTGTLATNPTGSVKFYLCGPAASDLAAQCGTATPPANGTYITPDGTLASGPGTSSTATSALATVTSVGHYCWRADYQGDSLYPPSSDRSLTECFTVTPVTPSLSTSASGGGNIPATITDTGLLTGTANEPGTPVINPTTAGSAAKGTVTFTVYGPNDSSCTTPSAFATPNTATASVNGDGSYSVSVSVSKVGTYTFVASYGGDSPNTNAAAATSCGDTNEQVTVTDTSSVISAQTWLPNDSATASSGSGNTALNGTLSITLYESTDCSGTAVAGQTYTKTLTNATSAADRTLTTNNTSYTVSVTKSVSWLVTFTSSDPNVSSATSHCETTSLTITN